MLLDQIDAPTAQIGQLGTWIEELIAAILAAQGVDADGTTGPGAGLGQDAPVVPAIDRLNEIPGISRFPTVGHLLSGAKVSPRTIQSGAASRAGRIGKGTPYLKAVLGEAAAVGRTSTFLGERYRRILKHRGKLRALVAPAPSW